MKDIFILIVVVIFIIVSLLEQMKKKQIPQPPAPQGDADDDWGEAVTTVNVGAPEWLFDENVEKPETEYSFSPEHEGERTISEKSEQTQKKPIQEEILFTKQFSLKQAVIYSEILNRKYT